MTVRDLAHQFERRLVQPDYVQLLTLAFGVVLFVFATRWAGVDTSSNDAWYGVAPARFLSLALLAMGYGAAYSERPRSHRLAALGTVVLAVLVTFPLELAAYAASHPANPLWWGLAAPLAGGVAYFGTGLALGRVSSWVRLRSVLPLTVPGLLVGLIWVDIRLGTALLNPFTTATVVAPAHLALAGAVAVATIFGLLRGSRAPEDTEAAA